MGISFKIGFSTFSSNLFHIRSKKAVISLLNLASYSSRKMKLHKKSEETSRDVLKYLNSKPCLEGIKDLVPDRFLKVKKARPSYSFVIDDDVAVEIANTFKNELDNGAATIDGSPGLGLLARQLLNSGVPRVLIFDPMVTTPPTLVQLMNENPEKAVVIPSQFFDVHKLLHLDKLDEGTRFDTVFKDIKAKRWHDDPAVQIIGVIFSTLYLHNLLKSIISRDSLTTLGRIQHFAFLDEVIYQNVMNGKGRMRFNFFVLFHELFEVEDLRTFPRQAFLPWCKKDVPIEDKFMHLVKFTPKKDIYHRYDGDKLKVLWKFVRNLCHSRQNKVIPYFEKWIPSSGLVLIKDGLTPMTEVGDLTAQEIIQVFNTFTSLPEYKDTDFCTIQERDFGLESDDDEKPASRKSR